MKYRVKTDQFKGVEMNEIKEYDDLTPLQQNCVDTGYDCFEAMPGIEVGQYWRGFPRLSDVLRVSSVHDETFSYKYLDGNQCGCLSKCKLIENGIPITVGETKQALIAEAKRRGLYSNKIMALEVGAEVYPIPDGGELYNSHDELWVSVEYTDTSKYCIYRAGEWAEIVTDVWGVSKFETFDEYKVKKGDRCMMCIVGERMNKDEAEAIAEVLNNLNR